MFKAAAVGPGGRGCDIGGRATQRRTGLLACSVAPGTPWRPLSCQLASQGRARLAASFFPPNLLTQQPYVKNRPAGMDFALSSGRHPGGAPWDARGSTRHNLSQGDHLRGRHAQDGCLVVCQASSLDCKEGS